jgi:hypothetical protein
MAFDGVRGRCPLAARPASGENRRIATPARKPKGIERPPLDPVAVPRNLARARAKRRARIEHDLERKRARVRFYALLGGLVFVALFVSLSIWQKIETLFGL